MKARQCSAKDSRALCGILEADDDEVTINSNKKFTLKSGLYTLKNQFNQEFYVYKTEILSLDHIIKASISAAVGSIFGVLTSLIINCTLIEVSLSPFFASYFGILFLSVGFLILWRIKCRGGEETDGERRHLSLFGILILISGIFCFVLEENWFVALNPFAKVPVYTVLGVGIAFALAFSLVDFVNYFASFFQHSLASPVVESNKQGLLIMTFSLLKGASFGFIFGILDLEDVASYHLKLALYREEQIGLPIGALLGALAGFANEYLRKKDQLESAKISDTSMFDDDI